MFDFAGDVVDHINFVLVWLFDFSFCNSDLVIFRDNVVTKNVLFSDLFLRVFSRLDSVYVEETI